MSDLVWQGFSEDGGARLAARVTAAGTLTAQINDDPVITGDVVSTDNLTDRDGIGVVDVGMIRVPSTYRMYLDGVEIGSGKVRPIPQEGDTFRMGWSSCWNMFEPDHWAAQMLENWDVRFIAAEDDMPYADSGGSGLLTIPRSSVDTDLTLGNFFANNEALRRYPQFRRLCRDAGIVWQPGDHGIGNDWDHTVAVANDNETGNTSKCVDQAAVDALYVTFKNCQLAYGRSNPRATGVDLTYGSWDMGDCTFIHLDQIEYKSANNATDDVNKLLLGAAQEAFLIDAVTNSTKTWKIVLSTYRFQVTNAAHLDSWSTRTTEQARIKAALAGTDNVVWLTGDQHCGLVFSDDGVIDICACPVNQALQANASGYQTGVLWKSNGIAGAAADGYENYGILEVVGSEKLIIRIVQTATGGVVWRGEVLPSANAISYPPRKTS